MDNFDHQNHEKTFSGFMRSFWYVTAITAVVIFAVVLFAIGNWGYGLLVFGLLFAAVAAVPLLKHLKTKLKK